MKKTSVFLIAFGAAVIGGVTAATIYNKTKFREPAGTDDTERMGDDAIEIDSENILVADGDGDGKVDTVMLDTDGDGKVDTILLDTDGNGELDTVLADTTGDGNFDSVISEGLV